MNSQYKKGVMEICVLALLDARDMYGYELVETISAYISTSDGTIYPMLRRFKKESKVETYLVESDTGPSRKYYKLTKNGKAFLEESKDEWYEFVESVDKILRRKVND